MKIRLVLALMFFSLTGGSLFAQVTSVQRGDFSDEAVVLNFTFPRVAAPGDLSDVFSRWGVSIAGEGGGTPILANGTPEGDGFLGVVSNQPPGDSSAGLGLVFDLRTGARRVGLSIGNGGPGVTATISAYDRAGRLLGRVESGEVPETFDNPLFVGVETDSEHGISKLTVDYGDAPNPEQVSLLIADFVNRPLFTTVVAQVGRGRIRNNARLETLISIVNLDATTARGRIRLFDDDGNELEPGEESGLDETDLKFRLPAFLATSLDTRSLQLPAFSGYAVLESNVPVTAACRFQAFELNGALISESGVGADRPRTFLVGAVQRRRPERVVDLTGYESALALANPGDLPARIDISVFEAVEQGDQNGTPVRRPGAVVELAPGQHMAQFLSQLVPDIAGEDFDGSIVIRSNQPIAATLIETVRGLPSSSVPLSPLEN